MNSLEARIHRAELLAATEAGAALLTMLLPKEHIPIVDWVARRVDLSYDHTAAANGLIRLHPYQIEPLTETDNPACQQVTLCWSPRLGKSTIWKLSLLHRLYLGGLSGVILYPTMDEATRTNEDTVLPLISSLPEVRRDLAARGGRRKESYHLPSVRSIIYYRGGTKQITSLTANWGVLDESDQVAVEASGDAKREGKNIDQLKALRTRMQTFREKMLIDCSSPTLYGGSIYKSWEHGSRGVWHLRCLNCGRLWPTSRLAWPLQNGEWAGLQWEKTPEGDVIHDSIRWICPACGRRHTESEAAEMNRQGCFVHANAQNVRHRSFQAGALACPDTWPWWQIAESQESAINPDSKQYLRNYILGMPYKHEAEGTDGVSIEEAIRAMQVDYPDDLESRLAIVCAGVDQQKSALAGSKYYVYAVRGWDEAGNSWLLQAGTANSVPELDSVLSATYHGHRVSCAFLDQGGFDNAQELDPYVATHANAYYYKGEDSRDLKGKKWVPSQNQKKLFLCGAIAYQVALLHLLYDPPRPEGYAWRIPKTAPAEYLQQIANVRPNTRMTKDANGQAYHNWCATGSDRRDYFDAEKMCLAAMEIACHYFPPTSFRHGNKPLFIRREWLAEAKLRNLLEQKRRPKE